MHGMHYRYFEQLNHSKVVTTYNIGKILSHATEIIFNTSSIATKIYF